MASKCSHLESIAGTSPDRSAQYRAQSRQLQVLTRIIKHMQTRFVRNIKLSRLKSVAGVAGQSSCSLLS